MTLRITQELYERLQWALSIRPDLTLSDVCRLAMNYRVLTGQEVTAAESGPVVLNIDFRGAAEGLTPQQIRVILAGYLTSQREKIEARRPAPLDLEPCQNYIVDHLHIVIEDVVILKEGTGAKGPWVLVGIKVAGVQNYITTFDKSWADYAKEGIGHRAEFTDDDGEITPESAAILDEKFNVSKVTP
jgi:hypothetical protein